MKDRFYLLFKIWKEEKKVEPILVPVNDNSAFLKDCYFLIGCESIQALSLSAYLPQYPYLKDYVLVCDEEGKLKDDWMPSLPLVHNGKPYDYIADNFLIFLDGEEDFEYLSSKECYRFIELWQRYLKDVLSLSW